MSAPRALCGSRTLRLCLLTSAFTAEGESVKGGVERYNRHWVEALVREGHEVYVLVYDGTRRNVRDRDGVRVHHIRPVRIAWFSDLFPGVTESLSIGWHLLQLDRRIRFHHIEGSNEEGLQLFAVLWARDRFHLRFFSSLRQHIVHKGQGWTWPRRFAVWWDGLAVRATANWVTHSHSHAVEMAQEYGIQSAEMTIIPLATTLPARQHSGCRKNGEFWIGAIGTLDKRKGIDVLLEAIPTVLATCPVVRFVLIGRDGGDSGDLSWKDRFVRQHSEWVQSGRVIFTGHVSEEDAEKFWNKLSIVVVPSRYESFGYAVIEGFARRIPVLVSNAGSLTEVAGEAAEVFNSGDPLGLVDRIRHLTIDQNMCKMMAEKGWYCCQKEYSLDVFKKRLIRYYLEVNHRLVSHIH